MRISAATENGRRVWKLDNDLLDLTVMQGGGHISGVAFKDRGAVNPLWKPSWKTIEPWQYRSGDERRYEAHLLSCISGHNLCLPWFGEASQAETECGLGIHGEAPVARWRLMSRKNTARTLQMVCGCEMKATGLDFRRTIRTRKGSP